MIPTDEGTTTLAWTPILLTLGVLLIGVAFVMLAEYRLYDEKVLRDIALRIGWWFVGAGCGIGGLLIWWMVT